jgi:hypothetical protein
MGILQHSLDATVYHHLSCNSGSDAANLPTSCLSSWAMAQ